MGSFFPFSLSLSEHCETTYLSDLSICHCFILILFSLSLYIVHHSVFMGAMFIQLFYQHFIADATGCYRYGQLHHLQFFFSSNLRRICVHISSNVIIHVHAIVFVSLSRVIIGIIVSTIAESRYRFGALLKCAISG